MTDIEQPAFRLDEERRCRVRDCLKKAAISLPPCEFERFVGRIEISMQHFLAAEQESEFRKKHDALRRIWQLAYERDPPVAVLRARLKKLPKSVIRELDNKAKLRIPRLFRGEAAKDGFLAWSEKSDGSKLIRALQNIIDDGGQRVAGRSRGDGRRDPQRLEPLILGEVRGGSERKHKGGRPTENARHQLVMNLACDWALITGRMPKLGRSDATGFGDLVHSVFQWFIPDEDKVEAAATYSLRRYWAEVRRVKQTRISDNIIEYR